MNTKRRRAHANAQARYAQKQPPEWSLWKGIKARCHYSKHPYFFLYGGRGIKVCDRWREHGRGFQNFMADVGPRPSPTHQLHRINSNQDYTKENVTWLPADEHTRLTFGHDQPGETSSELQQTATA